MFSHMYLVERDALLDQLDRHLRDVAGGRGHLVLVGGEAGIGKTSLLAALAARRESAAVWWGACDALQTPHPLAPLHDVARAAKPAFAGLLGSGDRVALFECVLTELQQAPGATLFVIEDAHWADAATLDLLKFLGRRIQCAPCLIVVSYRDDEVSSTHPLRRLAGELPSAALTRIDVPRLSPAGVDELARRALRAPAGIHAVTQGNPFFVTELLRQGVEGVPRGVQDLVLARLARLSAPAQDVVRLASIVPARIERRFLDELLAPTVAAVEECFDSGLLLGAADSYAFRHELARVAVESALSAPAAQALHARMLRVLERAQAQLPLARLAHHAAHAHDADAVLRYAPAAAHEARQRGAHKQAVAHLRIALRHAADSPLARRAELFDELSYECYLTGKIPDAIAARESALSHWRAAHDARKTGDALRWLSRLSWYNGQAQDAARYANEAIATLDALAPGRELAWAWSNRAQLHMLAGEKDAALHWGGKARQLAIELGEHEIEIHALNNIGTAQYMDDGVSGRGDLETSLANALAGGFEEHAARAYTNLASSASYAHDFVRASEYLRRGIAYCEQRDLDSWARYMLALRADVSLALGDWPAAQADAEAILRAPDVAPISRVIALTVIGRLRARRGDADAEAALEEASRLAAPMQEMQRTAPLAAARAESAWLRGDGRATAHVARPAWQELDARRYRAWLAGELAWWLHKVGALDAAPRFCAAPYAWQIAGRWRDAAEAWAQQACPYERARALADGDGDAQLEALAEFERLGARIDAERLRKVLQAAGVRGVPRGQRASTRAHPHALTAREAQVLGLLCAGLKNAQIAQRLSRSVRTVDHHVAAIMGKLGVGSRSEVIATALQAGLVPK